MPNKKLIEMEIHLGGRFEQSMIVIKIKFEHLKDLLHVKSCEGTIIHDLLDLHYEKTRCNVLKSKPNISIYDVNVISYHSKLKMGNITL